MKSINDVVTGEIIINKSRFITILCPVNNKNEVEEKLKYYKDKYKSATHYCTSYIIDTYFKYDDDGEPPGTAGLPMLNVLQNYELSNVLCIVIRYFGGIKLGSGGLVRAYSKCVSDVINKANIISLVSGYSMELEFNYDDTKIIDHLLKNINIEKTFNETINYKFNISELDFLKIKDILNRKTKIIKKEPILVTV